MNAQYSVLNDLFNRILLTNIWVKEIDGKFFSMADNTMFNHAYDTRADAYAAGLRIQMIGLRDIAADIVGEGNEYKGVIGESLNRGE